MKLTALLFSCIFISILFPGHGQSTKLFEIGYKDSLYSSSLEEQRYFWVQLPESYDPNSQTNYPVVYVLDGGVHLKAVETVHSYYWGGFIPEMVIVGISNGSNRTRDLTTSKVEDRRGVSYNQESGGAEDFFSFIEKDLIPYIEGNYAVTDYRTLIGHSYAGLFTINAGKISAAHQRMPPHFQVEYLPG